MFLCVFVLYNGNITTLLLQLHKDKKLLACSIFLAVGLIVLGSWPFRQTRGEIKGSDPISSSSDFPFSLSEQAGILYGQPLLVEHEEAVSPLTPFMNSLRSSASLLAGLSNSSSYIYKVGKGENVSKIADKFGITSKTLLSWNPRLRSGSLRQGQTINLYESTAILHTTKSGETLDTISNGFKISRERLASFNRNIDLSNIGPGTTLIIPGLVSTPSPSSSLPDLKNYFSNPTDGLNWGKLHNNNGVDITNPCGSPVRSAAEGLVVASESKGWNGGAGSYVEIEHPNGTKTRYEHLESVSVSVGNYLRSGADIGKIGKTGEASECHLHFAVSGAKNPFARY